MTQTIDDIQRTAYCSVTACDQNSDIYLKKSEWVKIFRARLRNSWLDVKKKDLSNERNL